MSSFLRWLLSASMAMSFAHAPSGGARADETTTRYFEGLRDRRLFSLAEGYCLDQIARPRAPLDIRTAWTIELSKTFAEHARYVSGEEQDELWKRAEQSLQDLADSEPQNPRRLELVAQSGLLKAAQGEHFASLAELAPENETLVKKAVDSLSSAVLALREIDRTLNAAALKARSRDADAAGLSLYETRSLQETARFTLGSLLLTQARIFPRGNAERAASVLDAEEIFRRQASGVPGETVTWNARVAMAECARLKADPKSALAILAGIEKDEPPADVRDRLKAAQVQTLFDSGRPDEALSLLLAYQKQRMPLPPELQFLKTQSLLEMWDLADRKKSDELAGELWTQIEAQAEHADRDAGGWWGYRIRQAIEGARELRLYGRELAPKIRRAKAAWAAGHLDAAVTQYAECAALAARHGLDDAAVELGYVRGSILLQSQRFSEAAADFQAVAQRYPDHAKAADAHLLAAYCLGRLYETSKSAEHREAYQTALEQHRERFPKSTTFGDATWMLAVYQERRLQYTLASPLYAEVPAEHPRRSEAEVGIARCWEAILDRVRELKQPPAEWEAKAIAQLRALTNDDNAGPLERMSAEVRLRFARMRLGLTLPDYTEADRLLARVVESADARLPAGSPSGGEQSSEEERAAWESLRKAATQLRIVSLAGQKKWTQAESLVQQLSDVSPAVVLSVLDGLSQFGRTADAATQRGLGELQLKTTETLMRRNATLSEEERQRLQECRAQALAATNQPKAAIPVYEALLARQPNDAALRRTLADLLMQCGTPDCLTKARDQWKKLESVDKPGSVEWLTSRYENARAALLLGKNEECRKLLGVTRLLYPERGGSELARKYEELERSLRNGSPPR